jgi:hypothetical protein
MQVNDRQNSFYKDIFIVKMRTTDTQVSVGFDQTRFFLSRS